MKQMLQHLSSADIDEKIQHDGNLTPEEEHELRILEKQKRSEEQERIRMFIEAYRHHTKDHVRNIIAPNTTSAEEKTAVEYLLNV